MKTIVINNQKGGVGKTMLALHLAWFLAEEEGTRVLFVDFDGQANSSKVLENARQIGKAADLFDDSWTGVAPSEAGISVLSSDPRLNSISLNSVGGMMGRFSKLASSFDYCVFDTPPAWDARNFSAMAVSDGVISPIELQVFAIDGVEMLLRSIRAVEKNGRQGKSIDFLGLLPSRFNSHAPIERANLQGLLDKAARLVFPGVITVRDGYAQAMVNRVPVWSLKTAASKIAGAEIRGVLERIRARVLSDAATLDEVA